jgi:hypothetical protein
VNIKKRKLKAIGWAAAAVITLLCAVQVVFWGLQDRRSTSENLSVINQGERTTGTIISKKVYYVDEDYDAVGDEDYDAVIIKYRFVPSSGQELFGKYYFYPCNEKESSGWNVGDQIEIAYDQQNPTINLPVEGGRFEKASRVDTWFVIITLPIAFGLMTLFFGSLALGFGSFAWREWRLSKNSVS